MCSSGEAGRCSPGYARVNYDKPEVIRGYQWAVDLLCNKRDTLLNAPSPPITNDFLRSHNLGCPS